MSQTQLYLRHDVQRLVLALVVFIAVPCVLLVFLAYQSVRAMGESVLRQQRETARLELSEVGKVVRQRLDSLLKSNSETLQSLSPSQPEFWDGAIAHLSGDKILRTPLVLDSEGHLVIPHHISELPQEESRLSDMHPSKPTLTAAREAHWVKADYSRAITLYQQTLDSQYIPPSVRSDIWAEMAQSEQQRGNHEAALGDYEQMLAESQASQTSNNASLPLLFAVLRAAEVSQRLGLPERTQYWTALLLGMCENHWLDLNSEQLTLVTHHLARLFPEPMPTGIAQRLKRLEQFSQLRSAMTAFTREHGLGPFQLHLMDAHPNLDGATSLWHSPAQPLILDQSFMLIYTGGRLPDDHWLAFDINLEELRRETLEPALTELMRNHGGRTKLIDTPSPILSEIVNGPGPINYQLPTPLEFWTVSYDIGSSPAQHTLAASESRFKIALLILAALFITVGLVVMLFQIYRSVRLAQLQTDVIDRVSHEFKTPIAALAVLADTLARDKDTDAATHKQVVSLVYDETQSLVRLSNRLLSFAHLRSKVPRLHLSEDQLDNIVKEVVRLFPYEAGVEAASLALEIEPADYHGLFDRGAIEEIGRNILDNAVKYCDAPPRVRITLRRVDNECVLEVSDNGWGMDERVQRQIFKAYFRADTGLAAKVPGIGLGLTIVSNLVRAHGGAITVRSVRTQGSTFTVRLPMDMCAGIHL